MIFSFNIWHWLKFKLKQIQWYYSTLENIICNSLCSVDFSDEQSRWEKTNLNLVKSSTNWHRAQACVIASHWCGDTYGPLPLQHPRKGPDLDSFSDFLEKLETSFGTIFVHILYTAFSGYFFTVLSRGVTKVGQSIFFQRCLRKKTQIATTTKMMNSYIFF